MRDVIKNIKIDFFDKHPRKPYILLDGRTLTSHNIIRNLIIGKAANEVLSLNVGYLTKENKGSWVDCFFESYNVKPFEINSYYKNISLNEKIAFKAKSHYLALRREKIKNISYKNIFIGDLIYDTIVRRNKNVHTISQAPHTTLQKTIAYAFQKASAWERFLQAYNIAFMVRSHKVFVNAGVPSRIAINQKASFLSNKRLHLRRYDTLDEIRTHEWFLPLSRIDSLVKEIGEDNLYSYAKSRFGGQAKGVDVNFAFTEKTAYTEAELRQKIGIKNKKPIALIAPHVFSDGSYSDRDLIHEDYYIWFATTLKMADNINKINWVVKPHPSASLYGEEGLVEKMVQAKNNVALVPSDVRTDSVLRLADTVITVRGTIGMEALLFDCDVIIAGNSTYEEIPCIKKCKSENSYAESIAEITNKGTVSKLDKKRALACLYYRNKSYHLTLPELGEEVTPGMTRQEKDKINKANLVRFARFVRYEGLEKSSFYNKMKEFFRLSKKDLSIADFT